MSMLLFVCCVCFFFFKQKTAYEMRISDWSSDVCSSDLPLPHLLQPLPAALEIRPQPALLLDRLVNLPARRDGVRLFACRDLLGIRAPLDRGRGMAHLHGRLHLYALAGVATMIDPLGHLRQFQRVVDLFGPPLPDRLHLD